MASDGFDETLSNGSRTDRSQAKIRTLQDDERLFTWKYVQRFSPRSIEACAREGILPEELIPITMDEMDFDPADSPAVRTLRFEHAETRRRELLDIARKTRQKLVNTKWQPPPDLDQIAKKKIPVDAIQKIVGGATADMIESEKTRLQKLISRHEKELEQLVKAEIKTLSREERQKQKEQAQKQKEDALAKQRQKMKQEILEKARQMQQRRAEEEEKERQKRKQLRQEIYEKAMKSQQEQRERDRQRRLDARLKAEERIHRQQEFKQRSEAMNEAISRRILTKLQMMQIRDEMRRKKAEDQKRLAIEEKQRQAQAKRQRVERALAANQKKMEEKRLQLALQMESQSRQLENFAEHLQANYAEIQKQRREADQKRRKAKEEADLELQRKIHKVLDKNQQAEARKRELELKRLEQQELRKEQQRLRIQDKLMNVERKRRMDEYRRVHIASKIEQDFERSRILQRVKSDMIQERKRNHVLAQIQKEEIVKTFHNLQLSAGQKPLTNGRPQSAMVDGGRPPPNATKPS